MKTGIYMNMKTQFSYETKKSSMSKIMRLILDQVFMSDRHMSDGQMYLFLQMFSTLKKDRLDLKSALG